MDWRRQLRNFNEYLEGEAFRSFLTEMFDTTDSWGDLKESMMERFSASVAEPYMTFIHCRQKWGQALKKYYNEKRRIGTLSNLKDVRIVSEHTHNLIPELGQGNAS